MSDTEKPVKQSRYIDRMTNLTVPFVLEKMKCVTSGNQVKYSLFCGLTNTPNGLTIAPRYYITGGKAEPLCGRDTISGAILKGNITDESKVINAYAEGANLSKAASVYYAAPELFAAADLTVFINTYRAPNTNISRSEIADCRFVLYYPTQPIGRDTKMATFRSMALDPGAGYYQIMYNMLKAIKERNILGLDDTRIAIRERVIRR